MAILDHISLDQLFTSFDQSAQWSVGHASGAMIVHCMEGCDAMHVNWPDTLSQIRKNPE